MHQYLHNICLPLLHFLQKIHIPGLKGISVYTLISVYFNGIVKGSITTRAAAIAFSFILSSLPFLLFILYLIQLVPLDLIGQINIYLDEVLPPKTLETVHDILTDLKKNDTSNLFSYGFVAAMLFMSNGVNAIFDGFEHSWHDVSRRGFFRQYILAFLTAIIIAVLVVLTLSSTLIFSVVLSYLHSFGLDASDAKWIQLIRTIVPLIFILTAVSVLYYIGTPAHQKLPFFFSPGSILTSLLIVFNSFGFGYYVQKLANYHALYGSIGSIIILMIWVWLNMIILLLGYELNLTIRKHLPDHSRS